MENPLSTRATPEEYFRTTRQVNIPVVTQAPIPIISLDTTPAQTTTLTVDPNLVILGIVAIVGLLGLFALLGTRK